MKDVQASNAQAAARLPELSVHLTVNILGGKWKAIILYLLSKGEHRFNELRRSMPGITQRMLTLQLRELEKYGVIDRVVYPDSKVRVGYRLNELGATLIPLIRRMQEWGESYRAIAEVAASQESDSSASVHEAASVPPHSVAR